MDLPKCGGLRLGLLPPLASEGRTGVPAIVLYVTRCTRCNDSQRTPPLTCAFLLCCTLQGDFYAGGSSKQPAEVLNMCHGPRPGTAQNPQMLEKCTPAGVSVGGG
eukprot:gene16932-biopygen11345